MDPLISVVMPVYNGGKYLQEAIESILNQTEGDFEFIIIDDGSTDGSPSLIEKYREIDSRIKVITQENRGLISSLNTGIDQAKGKYIARMDADDISLPYRFEKQVELLNNGGDICGCHFKIINEKGDVIDSKDVETENFPLVLMSNVPFAHGSVLIRRDFLNRKKLRYGGTRYTKAEDYQFWCVIFNNGGQFRNLSDCQFKYREVEGSLSSNKKNMHHACLISYEFMKENELFLINNILDSNDEVRLRFRAQILKFSFLTLFSNTKKKISFISFPIGLINISTWLLKVHFIRLMSRFND